MYASVFKYTLSKENTEDILQNAFTKVFKYLPSFNSNKGSLQAWVRRICISSAIDFIKKQNVKFENLEDLNADLQIEDLNLQYYDVDYILQMVAELNYKQRTIFNLYVIEGYSHKEIAQLLGIKEHSSKVELSRAKKQLRTHLSSFNNLITKAML